MARKNNMQLLAHSGMGRRHITFAAFFFFILFASIAFAQNENFNPTTVSSISTKLSREGKISATSGELYNLKLSLTIPQNTSYQRVSLKLSKEASVVNDNGNQILRITYEPRFTSYPYTAYADVETKSRAVASLPSKYSMGEDKMRFTKETEHTQISPEIRSLAKDLTQGYKEDIDKVSVLAVWVNTHMTYDINEVGKNRNATDVYSNPKGVCVEYVNLFMALSRSLGYPTRSVLGYVYSPKFGWQLHSWSEVYIGEWVGVDPTWLQVGYIDATHIPMYYSDDTNSELIEYANAYVTDPKGQMIWEGKGELGGSTGDITIVNYNASALPYEVKVVPDNLTMGEDGAIIITVDSPEYRMFTAHVVPCEGEFAIADFGDELDISALLHPGKNNIVIPFKVSSLLSKTYTYSCPVGISHNFGTSTANINVDAMAKPTKKFSAILSKYYGRTAQIKVTSLSDDQITVVKDRGVEMVSATAGFSQDYKIDLSDGLSRAIVVYDDTHAQVIRIPKQEGQQSDTIYQLNDFYLTSSIPSDGQGQVRATFDVTTNASYTAKVYIDENLVFSETSESPTYTLDYTIEPTPGTHSITVILDMGPEEYRYDGSYEVFDPQITVTPATDDNRLYMFTVKGPYQAYQVFVDGTEVNPAVGVNLTGGTHEVKVQWIDNAGNARTYSGQFAAGSIVNGANGPLCAGAALLVAIPLILVYINTRKR